MGLYGQRARHIAVGLQPIHVIAAIVVEHDGHGHTVVQDGAWIVGIGARGVLAPRFFRGHPDIEHRGLFQNRWGQLGERVLVAKRCVERHGRALRTTTRALDHNGLAFEGFGVLGVLCI